MIRFLEQLIARFWNRMRSRHREARREGRSLQLGWRVTDGTVTRLSVGLSSTRRAMHIAVPGKTRTGKSSLLRFLCQQDIEADRTPHVVEAKIPKSPSGRFKCWIQRNTAYKYNGLMEIPFDEYAARVQKNLETFYGIHVVTRDIPDPLTGDLDGLEIHIDCAVTPEQRLFLLGHLFGHTVQWNADAAAFEIGRQYQPPVAEELIPGIIAYEREAACYGLAMFHQIGITGLDQWFCDYTACDQAYLLHFYRTGEKRDFRAFWRIDAPAIEPKPVPVFRPTRRSFRMDGIVI